MCGRYWATSSGWCRITIRSKATSWPVSSGSRASTIWSTPGRIQGDQPGGYDEYGRLLAQFIRDVRKDLSAPKMPFVIGVMGIGWQEDAGPNIRDFRQAHGRAGIACRVQGQRGGGADGTLLGRRVGRVAAAEGEVQCEDGSGVQEESELESGGERRGPARGPREKPSRRRSWNA